MMKVPDIRIDWVNKRAVNPKGDYVLYWMAAFRRTRWNFSLDRAVEWARELKKPLVIFEDLRCGNEWDSDRFHRFAIDGMEDTAEDLAGKKVLYYPYVEKKPGEADKLLFALSEAACVVVTDEFPCLFHPQWVKQAGRKMKVKLEQVDSNGVVPLRAEDEVFKTAYSFRRAFQREFYIYLEQTPKQYPLSRLSLPTLDSLPKRITDRWASGMSRGNRITLSLDGLPIDHKVAPCKPRGGARAAEKAWKDFLRHKLGRYVELRNEPEADVTSGLSPHLHFGHISGHQIVAELAANEEWTPDRLAKKGRGKRRGWWGMSEGAENFLDQVITWRELGYNMSSKDPDYNLFDSLPDWARKTLAKHAKDSREHIYSEKEFEEAGTYDSLWNAAQNQLVTDGMIHNYLRMLWGKKIIEWSKKPEEALELMIHLNNKYALDGRNPNSYSGIFWCFGRYDRPWGPERPIFGTVRYMSSENTARKVSVKNYIRKYRAELD